MITIKFDEEKSAFFIRGISAKLGMDMHGDMWIPITPSQFNRTTAKIKSHPIYIERNQIKNVLQYIVNYMSMDAYITGLRELNKGHALQSLGILSDVMHEGIGEYYHDIETLRISLGNPEHESWWLHHPYFGPKTLAILRRIFPLSS